VSTDVITGSLYDGDAVLAFLGLAAGEVSEAQLAVWIRGNMAVLGA
jgi:hypothetical protein